MADWVKLHSKAAESEDLAALYAADPTAALVFLLALPAAAPWGILPRHPALFAARVCPLFGLSPDKSETCLRLILDCGMFTEYEDRDGKTHLYVTAWTQNQSRQWERVGPPPCDLPPSWTPPPDLAKSIAAATRAKRWLTAEALESHLQDAESKTRLRLVLAESETSLRREVRGEKESPENGEHLSSQAADDAARDQPPEEPEADGEQPKPKRSALKRKPRSDEDLQADTTAERETLPPGLLPVLDLWLDNLASHNATGAMTAGRVLTETRGFVDLSRVHGLSEAAIRHGVTEALNRVDRKDGKPGIKALAYVLEAARGFAVQPPLRASPPAQSGTIPYEQMNYHDQSLYRIAHPERFSSEGVHLVDA